MYKRRKFIRFLKRYERIKKTHLLGITVVVSMFLALMGNESGGIKRAVLEVFPKTFLNVMPVFFVFRRTFFKKLRKNPVWASVLILYFLFLIPLFLGVRAQDGEIMIYEDSRINKYIAVVNTVAIVIGHLVLFKNVFLDVILKKRKSTGFDTLVVFMTYISLGVSFGFIYTLINLMSDTPAFYNMELGMIHEFGPRKLYFRHIYYSFITLASVGFGDIYPLSWAAQLFTVVEAVLGVFLLSFSLGIILNSEGSQPVTKKEKEEFKRELLKEIEEIVRKEKKSDEK